MVRAEPAPVPARPAPPRDERPVDYFAPCTLGLEAALVQELNALGAQLVESRAGGASVRGDRPLRYAANLRLRSAIPVQEQILVAPAVGKEALYEAVARVDWQRH